MTEPQKTAVIFGLANKRSIAWAIAQKLQQAGWRLAITYQNERLALEAKDLIADLPGADGFMCDVTQDDQLARLFADLKEKYVANDISVYSLIAVSRGALPLMTSGGGIVTLTYYGAEKVVPRYNLMGVSKAALEATVRYLANDLGPKNIRVNAISAGPIKTLASRGISGFGDMLKVQAEGSPLKRNVDAAEVGATAAFLLSDAGSGITGETLYVDCGYNIMGF